MSYPSHILHPEEIPSLNEVPQQLNKRRNIRFQHPLALETDENELPLVAATSFQDEVQRAVQNLFDRLLNHLHHSLQFFLFE